MHITKKYSKEYTKLTNSYNNIMNDYNSYHPTNYSIDYSVPSDDRKLINSIANSLIERDYNKYNSSLEVNTKRTPIDRIFDTLNVGNYMVAGFADGLVRDDLNPTSRSNSRFTSCQPIR